MPWLPGIALASIGKLPFIGKLPIEAEAIPLASIGKLPFIGKLPIEAEAIPGIG